MKNEKIELLGCILKIQGKEIRLSMEEVHALKLEIDKMIPPTPYVIKEPIYIPQIPYTPWYPPLTPQSPYIMCTTTSSSYYEK